MAVETGRAPTAIGSWKKASARVKATTPPAMLFATTTAPKMRSAFRPE